MKQNSATKEDPLPKQAADQAKDTLDGYKLFYEALPFTTSYSGRIVPRLRRPSRARA